MPRIPLHTRVEVDGIRGAVVRHSPKGMVDIRPDGEDFTVRKKESDVTRSNPSFLGFSWGSDKSDKSDSVPTKTIKAKRLDPKKSWQRAVDLYYESGKKARHALVLASDKQGEGTAWYWLPLFPGLGVQGFQRASGWGRPKAYILDKDPTRAVLTNLAMFRYPEDETYISIDTFTGTVRGPFNGAEILASAEVKRNPSRPGKPDVQKKQDEQFRAVVMGIYESMMAKKLGVKSIHPRRGERLDVVALRKGKISQQDVRDTLSRAFAIATSQGQKHGWLLEGSQQPTAKGKRRALARYKDKTALAKNEQDYELTLALARKSSPLRVVARGRGKSRRFHVEPQVPGINPKGYKTEAAAKGAITRLRRNPAEGPATPPRPSEEAIDKQLADLARWARQRQPQSGAMQTGPGKALQASPAS